MNKITITLTGEPKKDCVLCKGKGNYDFDDDCHIVKKKCSCQKPTTHTMTEEELKTKIYNAIPSRIISNGNSVTLSILSTLKIRDAVLQAVTEGK